MAVIFQRFPDSADATVHHVRGGNHVSACIGMGQGLFDQRIHGDIVEHIAVVIDDAVLTMGGERVQRAIGDNTHFRHGRLDGAHGTLGQPIRIPGFAAVQGFHVGRGDRKQGHGGDAQLGQFAGFFDQQIDTFAFHTGHGGHRFGLVAAFQHKDRVDQVVHGESVLAHQPTGEVIATHAAHTSGGPGCAGDRHGEESSSNMGPGAGAAVSLHQTE